jgi:hypothetical protein
MQMEMIEKRRHKRVPVQFWVSLSHPLLGVVTGQVQEMSHGGLSLTLDDDVGFFTMMELEARIHGEGWDDSMPPLAVQVVRAQNREIAMKFMDVDDEDSWEYSLLEDEIAFDFNDMYREIQSTV